MSTVIRPDTAPVAEPVSASTPARNRAGALILSGILLASFCTLYGGVIAKLVRDWSIDDNYSHGFLVAPLAIYFAWQRRQAFALTARKPSAAGFLLVLASSGLLFIGVLGAEVFTTEISLLGSLTGLLLFLHGWRRLRIMAFPLAFLILMVPLPAIVFNQVALPLQFVASSFAEHVLSALRIPVLRDGNVIHLPRMDLEVEEACSGIRSLVSLLTLGVVYSYFMDSRRWVRVGLVAATIPVAIIANGLRVAGTGVAAFHIGTQAAEGFLHSFSGWLVFVTASVMLVLIHRCFKLFPLVRKS